MSAALLSLRRLRHIVAVLAVHAAALLVARRLVDRRLGGGEPRAVLSRLARRFPLCGLAGPERLRRLFEDLGGTFIKFGQMLALQPDVLPVAYCDALLQLLDRIKPFPWADAERIVREELGAAPDELFERFERRPIATASVGQVYRAVLDGRPVAVKVQRPDVDVEFRHDVRLMVAALFVVRGLGVGSWQWLLDPMGEFVAWSREELDYRFEARYGQALRRQAAGSPMQYVPYIDPHCSTRRVLVAELLDGTTLLDYLRARESGDRRLLDALERRGFDPRRFAANVVSNFLGDAFRHGIYHADLHPANLMILDDNVVGYMDFGITGVLSRYSRRHLVGMSLGLARGDVEAIYREYLKITSLDDGSDLAGFRAGREELSAGWYDDGAGGRRLTAKVTLIFNQIFSLSRRCRLMPERDIVKYIRSSIAIDGLLARFAPGHDIGLQIAERCSEYLRGESRLGWTSPQRAVDGWSAAARLFAAGPAHAGAWPQAFAATPRAPARQPPAGRRPRPLVPAAAAALAALLFALSPGVPALGVNLWTAELAVVGASCLVLAGTLRRREG